MLFNSSFDDKSRLPSDYNNIIQHQNPDQSLSCMKLDGICLRSFSSDTTRRTEEENWGYGADDSLCAGAEFNANDGLEDSPETDEDLTSDADEEEIAEDETDHEEDAFNADQDTSHPEPEASKDIEIERINKRKRTFIEIEE